MIDPKFFDNISMILELPREYLQSKKDLFRNWHIATESILLRHMKIDYLEQYWEDKEMREYHEEAMSRDFEVIFKTSDFTDEQLMKIHKKTSKQLLYGY